MHPLGLPPQVESLVFSMFHFEECPMQDEFANRSAMFQTSRGTLDSPTNKPIWFQQIPLVFTTKVDQATSSLADLETLAGQQDKKITGASRDKQREEIELEDAAHLLGGTLAIWFRDQGDETQAAHADLPLSGWQHLRNQQLLEKARQTRDLAQSMVSGPQAATAATYGVTAAAVTSLTKEIDDFAAVITAPQQSIAERKGLTSQLRDRFNAVEAQFAVVDHLILQFGTTAAGRALIAAYQASRTISDLGHGPATKPTPTPPYP
jgi:hypothetical protein